MARTHFSVGDVEALIPKLERIFTDVLQLRAALRGIEEKLERAGVKRSREELLESDDGSTDVRRAKALFRGFYEALSDEIELVRALAGEVECNCQRACVSALRRTPPTKTWSPFRRAAAPRTSCCAGGWPRRRSVSRTAWSRALRADA